ncbi:MAG: InlB B-repeat-containing protein [Nakamurella sp.]
MTPVLRLRLRAASAPLVRLITVASLAAGSLLVGGGSAALAVPAADYTDCADVVGNLVPDCSFENFGIGWTPSATDDLAMANTGYGGSPHSGEVMTFLAASRFVGSSASWSTSVQVVAGGTYSFGVWWRPYNSGRPGTVSMSVSGAVADATRPSAPVEGDTVWATLSGGSFRATASGPVTLEIRNTSTAIVLLDDAALWIPGGEAASVVAYAANAPEAQWQGVLPASGSYSNTDGPYVVAAPEDLIRFDFDFTGWNTKPDGTGDSYRPGAVIRPAQNVNLYAQWRRTTRVELNVSGHTQVYRTTDPLTLSVSTRIGPDFVGDGIVRFKHDGVVIGTVPLNVAGAAAMRVPTSLPLGRASFTAEFTPFFPEFQPAESAPVYVTVARVSTITTVTLRQQALSAADQKKYKVRTGMSASVQVAGIGTRTVAPGSVALTIGGKMSTLKLANGRAKTALVPTAAGARTVVATYRPSTDFWVRSTGRAEITVR